MVTTVEETMGVMEIGAVNARPHAAMMVLPQLRVTGEPTRMNSTRMITAYGKLSDGMR